MLDKVEVKSIVKIFFEYVWVIAGALILASTLRAFSYEPYKIPSGSMVPTLLIGDFLFVNKYEYGFRNPCTGARSDTGHAIERGDVVVFEKKKGYACGMLLGMGSLNFIKRVVAVPGDTISYSNKTLFVNGEVMKAAPIGEFTYTNSAGSVQTAKHLKEDLAGLEHDILKTEVVRGMNLAETIVPAGKYVVMGDNRDNSLDSRFWNYPDWSYVKAEDIVGKAKMLFWSWNEKLIPRFERIGSDLVAQKAE